VSEWREARTGFALHSQKGLEYALTIQATGKTAAEVHRMDEWDRRLTALLQARYIQETTPDEGAYNGQM